VKIENPLISFGSYFINKEGPHYWGINISLIYINFTIFSFIIITLILIYLFRIYSTLSNLFEYLIIIIMLSSIIGLGIYYSNFFNSYYKYEIANDEIILKKRLLFYKSKKININDIDRVYYVVNGLKKKYKEVLFPDEIMVILRNNKHITFQIPDEIFIKMFKNNKDIIIPFTEIGLQEYIQLKNNIEELTNI